MDRGFARAIWKSFKSALSAVIGLVAFVLSLTLWLLASDTKVSLSIVVPLGTLIVVVLLTAVLTLLDTAISSYDRAEDAEESQQNLQTEYDEYKARSGLPRVVEGRESFAGIEAKLVCFLESSDLFSHDIVVTFYMVNEQNLEEPIGVGVIINIQENGVIQAAMTRHLPGHADFLDRLKQNEGEAVRNTTVKPNMPRGYAKYLATEGA